MAHYIIAYIGAGKQPSSPEEGAAHMEKWKQWLQDLGPAVVNPGTPLKGPQIVSDSGVADPDPSSVVTGLTVVEADSQEAAVEMAESKEERFALAVQATNFQLAFETCSQINTPEHWKLLGDEALKQGIYEAYELASQKQKHYDKLNFLFSLQHNHPKLEKMIKLAGKLKNSVLAYNAALFLNSPAEKQQILRDCGLNSLAEMAAEA